MIWNLLVGLSVGVMIAFIGINMMLGCEDWSKSNCVTPKDMWEAVIYDAS